MLKSCPLGMGMRRDGESRGRREAGERDLVIKSRVYLGPCQDLRRGGMGGGSALYPGLERKGRYRPKHPLGCGRGGRGWGTNGGYTSQGTVQVRRYSGYVP